MKLTREKFGQFEGKIRLAHERPEKDPEEAHEVEAVPERRVGVEGGAVVPADVGRAEEGPELAERRLPLVGEGEVGGRAAEVVLVLVVAVGHYLVLLKVLAEVLGLDVEVVAGACFCGVVTGASAR